MAKKTKIKKTLVEQILSKAKIEYKGLQLNALAEHQAAGLDRSYDSPERLGKDNGLYSRSQ